MNAKNSLLVLAAVMLLVSQLLGEGSTIASVASSDDAELQQAMKKGEEAITQVALGSNKTTTTQASDPARTDATSLSDFYDVEEEVQELIPEDVVSDDDPDAEDGGANSGPTGQGAGTLDEPFAPFAAGD